MTAKSTTQNGDADEAVLLADNMKKLSLNPAAPNPQCPRATAINTPAQGVKTPAQAWLEQWRNAVKSQVQKAAKKRNRYRSTAQVSRAVDVLASSHSKARAAGGSSKSRRRKRYVRRVRKARQLRKAKDDIALGTGASSSQALIPSANPEVEDTVMT